MPRRKWGVESWETCDGWGENSVEVAVHSARALQRRLWTDDRRADEVREVPLRVPHRDPWGRELIGHTIVLHTPEAKMATGMSTRGGGGVVLSVHQAGLRLGPWSGWR